jgi:putative transposase
LKDSPQKAIVGGMKRGAHTLWECKYHLVWCPKYRKDIFSDKSLREYTWELFGEIAKEYELGIEAMEIAEDHVHMMAAIPPKYSVAEIMNVIKSISAREIFKKFTGIKKRLWAGELWKDGYFVRSVGSDVTGEMVKKYIDEHSMREGNPAQLRLDFKPQRA